MYCRNCGVNFDPNLESCPNCKSYHGFGRNYCQACGQATLPHATVCARCGALLTMETSGGAQPAGLYQPKSRLAAGLLGIFLGGFGVHSFYLGDTTRGVIQILVTIFTCGLGSLWGFIEGIMIIAGAINTDANGNPLGQ